MPSPPDRIGAAPSAWWLVAATLLAVLFLAAGCQPLPHPFQPEDKEVAPGHLRALVSNSLFIVRPLEGVPEPLASAYADALAEELQRREVPATARQLNARAVAIAPVVAAMPPEAGIGPLRIDYLLVEANGRSRPVASDELPVEGAAFHAGDAGLVTSLAQRGSRRLLETVFRRPDAAPRLAQAPAAADRAPAGPAPLGQAAAGGGSAAPGPAAPAAAPRRPKAEFYLFDVSGAPGDGNQALARAMRRLLASAGVPFVREMTPDAFILAGAVKLVDASAGRQRVFIDWTLLAPDGEEIGTVSVDNIVPRGSLDGAWGPVAEAASAGSAEGMLQLIQAVLNSLPPE